MIYALFARGADTMHLTLCCVLPIIPASMALSPT